MSKKVFVSGCFDLLHSGHVAFFQEAAQYGQLYVAIGSDENVFRLKNRPPINSQAERMFMIKSLACVYKVFVARGSGILDFVEELKEIRPDYFVVNHDGSTPEKAQLCADLGIEYVVLNRVPAAGLEARSTTSLRGFSTVSESLILDGALFGWPEVSKFVNGAALTLSIHSNLQKNSPTRDAAIEMWGARQPADRPEKLSKILFGYCNLPGSREFCGAANAIGLVYPGLTRTEYAAEPWPVKIEQIQDENILSMLEASLYLRPLPEGMVSRLAPNLGNLNADGVETLSKTVEVVWQALKERDLHTFGRALRNSFEAGHAIQPHPAAALLHELVPEREQLLGWQLGADYLILVSDIPLENAFRVSIRRATD